MQLSFTMDFDKFIIILHMDRYDNRIVQGVKRFYKDEKITRDDIKNVFIKIDQLPVKHDFKSKIELYVIDALVREYEIQNYPDIFLEMNRTDLQAFLLDRIAEVKHNGSRYRL